MHYSARRRVAMVMLLPISLMIMSSIAAGLTGAPAGAAGILPPGNPASNIAQAVRTGWHRQLPAPTKALAP